jgi:predicted nucleic acid-binding protein
VAALNYLCDTNVLIEYLRGNAAIRDRLLRDKAGGLAIPAIALMELLVGARNQNEIRLIKKTFKDYCVIEINETISTLARRLIESYGKSRGLLIPDALIAAAAITRKLPLYTLNLADFQFIPQLKLA